MSRAITKEGPAALRLAFYQAANVARKLDPQLASPYELRDLDRTPVTRRHAKELASSLSVPEVVRRRSRARSTANRRGRLGER
ncbi:MAG: hypothetical protein M3450_17710 [Actinomycetota bacterium]|nr:hypothetical protein [Actinomycetota bacterium]